jgi:hypothetical protein
LRLFVVVAAVVADSVIVVAERLHGTPTDE